MCSESAWCNSTHEHKPKCSRLALRQMYSKGFCKRWMCTTATVCGQIDSWLVSRFTHLLDCFSSCDIGVTRWYQEALFSDATHGTRMRTMEGDRPFTFFIDRAEPTLIARVLMLDAQRMPVPSYRQVVWIATTLLSVWKIRSPVIHIELRREVTRSQLEIGQDGRQFELVSARFDMTKRFTIARFFTHQSLEWVATRIESTSSQLRTCSLRASCSVSASVGQVIPKLILAPPDVLSTENTRMLIFGTVQQLSYVAWKSQDKVFDAFLGSNKVLVIIEIKKNSELSRRNRVGGK